MKQALLATHAQETALHLNACANRHLQMHTRLHQRTSTVHLLHCSRERVSDAGGRCRCKVSSLSGNPAKVTLLLSFCFGQPRCSCLSHGLPSPALSSNLKCLVCICHRCRAALWNTVLIARRQVADAMREAALQSVVTESPVSICRSSRALLQAAEAPAPVEGDDGADDGGVLMIISLCSAPCAATESADPSSHPRL